MSLSSHFPRYGSLQSPLLVSKSSISAAIERPALISFTALFACVPLSAASSCQLSRSLSVTTSPSVLLLCNDQLVSQVMILDSTLPLVRTYWKRWSLA